MIDVGGYRVHLYCTGHGTPTVMIAGAGFSFDWSLVQPEIAKTTRVCTYDASGTAWSDPGPPLTCPARVEQIHTLLANARIDGSFILVGLSVGALVSRLYASRYPHDVAGLVLVDHAFLNPAGDLPPDRVQPAGRGDSAPALIHQTPIVITAEDSSQFESLPERARQLHRWAASLRPALPTVETAEDCLAQLKDRESGPQTLGDRPLVVISTGNRNPNYQKLQTELLSLSRRSEQLMATRSFHSVEIDQPDVVVTAIGLVVDKVRQASQH